MKQNGQSARAGKEFKREFMLEQRKEELKTDASEKSSTLWKQKAEKKNDREGLEFSY